MPIFQRLAAAAALSVTLLAGAAHAQQPVQQPVRFPVVQLHAGIHVIHAEVAARPAEREQGLMFREKMGANEGMVFVFGAPADVCMWMKNTLIPLSVAFLDENGKVINIEDMKPQSLDSHCAAKRAHYALEMNLGWFKQRNIKPGSTIEGLPR
ncbi:DUF192 domain-containing protein [Oxalobacteraceae bacterium OM1]|nr:DUF192 domain-containing protein [Oxalobacteraceae bacterium OM1]